jgi:capsid protein
MRARRSFGRQCKKIPRRVLVLLAKRRVSVTRLNSMAPRILDHRGQHMGASDTAYSAASRRARELAAWQPPLASADVELAGESPTIAARSYDLERNHGVATDAIRVQVGNIVGTGLRLAAKPDYRALGRDKAWADAWDARLRRTGARSPIYRSSRRRVSCTLAARPCCNCARRCWPAMVWPWCFGCRIGRGRSGPRPCSALTRRD